MDSFYFSVWTGSKNCTELNESLELSHVSRLAMLPALTRRGGKKRVSAYRFWFPHIDGWADGYWLALSSPVHFFHHAVHVASREAMEKHRCRRGEDVITVLFGSASQDVHQRQNPGAIMPLEILAFFRFSFLAVSSEKSRSGRKKYEGKVGHVFSTLRLICQWKPLSESLQLSLLISYD